MVGDPAGAASAALPPDASFPGGDRHPKKRARYERGRALGKLRSSGVLETPQIDLIVDRSADPDEVERRASELRARGHRVRLVDRQEPEVVTESENPLSGHPEVLSVVVEDERILVVIPKGHVIEDDGTSLGQLALAVAKHHGSKARDIVVRRAEE